ncbi:phospholipase B1, membrane-associated isoform X1 [Tribolium castaneum]|nr:PREDICTED: phospholipase B1, membrane-associated isoform X1 [Tribolium castaneum]|eukprot:XP_968734.1 PREDICTED: phospholipase B1, membrane-associated isoform X1 [Tribolium castaneum]
MFTTKYFFVLLFTFVTPRPAEFDALIGPFRQIRLAAFKFINSTGRENLPILRARNKVQQVAKIAFPCPLNNTRSPQPPENVNKVRPGDIDVIAGLGDSITAGVGLMAVNLLQIFLEYRGIAATAGGEATWRKYLTLPNILKVFNPNLTGFATATTLTLNPESRFNVGESGAVSEDTPYMAKVMIKRMVEDPSIDIHKHWKMVTLMIGPNDFCSQICYKNNLTAILEEHRNDLLQVLRILKYNLPRTIVNVIPPPNLEILIGFTGVPPKCELSHLFECPCLFGPTSGNRQDIYIKLMKLWQKLDMEIVNSEEFDSDNFTVVLQPFTLDFFLPNTTKGVTDFSYLAEDCFHMSQKGNARIANALWNNIMEPVGQKSTRPVEIFEKFNCPSQERPYIFTRKNSVR